MRGGGQMVDRYPSMRLGSWHSASAPKHEARLLGGEALANLPQWYLHYVLRYGVEGEGVSLKLGSEVRQELDRRRVLAQARRQVRGRIGK